MYSPQSEALLPVLEQIKIGVVMRIAVSLVLLWVSLLQADAATCPSGVTAPTDRILMASTTNPAREAWIVTPDLTCTPYTLAQASLWVVQKEVNRIVSLPSDTESA